MPAEVRRPASRTAGSLASLDEAARETVTVLFFVHVQLISFTLPY